MSQRVFVTRATARIGFEIARAFSAEGASVFITEISEEALTAPRQAMPGVVTGK